MEETRHALTIGGRVNEEQLARVDAASALTRKPRAHFIVGAVLEKADEVLRQAISHDRDEVAA